MSQGNGIRARATRSKTRYLGVGNDVLPDSKNRRSPELFMTAGGDRPSRSQHMLSVERGAQGRLSPIHIRR
mgnify:CR=1 FL=1